ncbi:MAG TPA: hypothetical protein ENJ00_05540 [Phycisphaerales bacterium]|nr:hypothetical protein [Phycisphaerales bacterium]
MGIFLSPLLLLASWAGPRRAAAVSVVFVLLNSTVGLVGVVTEASAMPEVLPLLAVSAAVGRLIGSRIGAKRASGAVIRCLLAVVLLIAASKMLLEMFL